MGTDRTPAPDETSPPASALERDAGKGRFMPPSLTKTEARAFRDRWRRVNAREIEELRSTDLDVRLRQFNTLLAWARRPEWAAALAEGEAEVRERWARLRKALRG